MDHQTFFQTLPISKGLTGSNSGDGNSNNNYVSSGSNSASRHQTAKGKYNNSYSRSNNGKQNQNQHQQNQTANYNNNNCGVRFPNKHQRNGGGREPKQSVLGQQLHFEQQENSNFFPRGGYLGRGRNNGGFRGNRNKNYSTNNGNNGKVSAKERFVQANSQFVMSPFNDNSPLLADPDWPIPWELVEEVIFTSNTSKETGASNLGIVCPVCLCTPVAGKVTRCGHIYCWSCILHYLALSDSAGRACPICFEAIRCKAELKSVSIVSKIDYAPADYLTFALMKVCKSGTLALPVDFDFKEPKDRLPRNAHPTLDQFAKVFTAGRGYMTAIFEREARELAEQVLEYDREHMPEVVFVHEALEELAKRKSEYDGMAAPLALCEQFASLDASLSSSSPSTETSEDSSAGYIYFYQSEDGQTIYLHPLNVRMLKAEYGELSRCPARITAKIVDLHSGEGSRGDRGRGYLYLRHLPASCEYKIAEVELLEAGSAGGVLSQKILAEFAPEVAARRKDRQRKEKAQRARDRRIEVENRRKIYGIAPDVPTNFQLNNVADFPAYLNDEPAFLSDVWGSSAGVDGTASSSSSSTESVTGQLEQLGSSPPLPTSNLASSSFAKMLSAGSGNGSPGGSGNFFDKTLRKKLVTGTAATGDEGDEGASAMAMQSMNITLGDFFDNCIKAKGGSKKKRNGRKDKQ